MTLQQVTFTLNGIEKVVTARNADTLLHTLRETLDITSTKPGCNNGDCGSCTVLIDNTPFNACHMLTVEVGGFHITTIEGLRDTVMQETFINNWAIQCGYCTPGYILNGYALVTNQPDADERMIDEWLDSNICRCTGYAEIKQSMKDVLAMRRTYE